MHPHLDRCIAIIHASTAGVSPEIATRRSADGRWSIVEIVEHLQLAYWGTAKGLERCLERGAPSATHFSFGHKLGTFVVVKLGFFPHGRQAPKHVLPTGQVDLAAAIAAARRDLAWLDETATRARERFGSADVLDHPILGAFTVDEWMRFHWIHTRHHAKQIQARRA